MANRRFPSQFLFSFNHMPVYLEGSFKMASGDTSALTGSGIKAVTKVATGVFKVQLEDTYARYLGGFQGFSSATTGSTQVTGISPGTVYIIKTLGTTTQAQWVTAGVPSGVTAAVGLAFVCAATSSGTGTCSTQAISGITQVEIVGDPNLSITQLSDPHFFISTLGPTGAALTALIPVTPVDGSVLRFSIMLRNSSVTGKGE